MKGSSNNLVNKAHRKVLGGWFPFDPTIYKQINARLKSNYYSKHKSELLNDLSQDFSLFMYTIKELSKLAHLSEKQSSGERSSDIVYPVDIILQAELPVVTKILSVPPSKISLHSIDNINETKAFCFKETLLSASAAEVISESQNIDPQIGFSCALLRQLGRTLIAWNYEEAYETALSRVNRQRNLDDALYEILGFTPELLALRIAKDWKISSDIFQSEEEQDQSSEKYKIDHAAATITQICRVGEALARASNPKHYPHASAEWKTAEEVIKKYLGPRGIQAVYRKARERCRSYIQYYPEILDFSKQQIPLGKNERFEFSSHLFNQNIHLKQCPTEVVESIATYYLEIHPHVVLQDSVRKFLYELIPALGFSGVCLYMFEPNRLTLSPVIQIGKVSPYRLEPISLFGSESTTNLVASAFRSRLPLHKEHIRANGRKIEFAGAIGETMKTAVLYLELRGLLKNAEADPLAVFKSLQHCLNSLLHTE